MKSPLVPPPTLDIPLLTIMHREDPTVRARARAQARVQLIDTDPLP